MSEQDKTNEGDGLASENEDIEILQFTPTEFFDAMNQSKITNAKTLIAGLWLKGNLEVLDGLND